MLHWMQQVRKAVCSHDWRVTRFDARVIGEDGVQYELEWCPYCLEYRKGAVVKRAR